MIVQVANIVWSLGEECTFANVGDVGPEVTWVACGDFFLFFFFQLFCSSSEVMNGNGYSASSDVSRSSLFCAAKHDLWQEREGGISDFTICPPALFHIVQKEFGGIGLTQATAHIWFEDTARPFSSQQPFEGNRWKWKDGNMMWQRRE